MCMYVHVQMCCMCISWEIKQNCQLPKYIPLLRVYLVTLILSCIQNSTVSLKAASEKVRTTLKEIETLSYSSGHVNDLIRLNDQLQLLKSEFETTLPHLEGLIIRPAVVSAALKTKRKYAYIRAKRYHTQCSALKLAKGRSRKNDSRFKNRVGIRADRLRKVFVHVYMYMYVYDDIN